MPGNNASVVNVPCTYGVVTCLECENFVLHEFSRDALCVLADKARPYRRGNRTIIIFISYNIDEGEGRMNFSETLIAIAIIRLYTLSLNELYIEIFYSCCRFSATKEKKNEKKEEKFSSA